MAEREVIYVASRSPSIIGDGGTGEFEWRFSRMEAAVILAGWLVKWGQHEETNMALTTIEVPTDLDAGGITSYIDANWHLIEVALQSD